MDVILLAKIDNLGNLGDKVNVRAGYARNYLIPQGKAKYATPKNLAEFEARRSELEKAAADALTRAKGRAASLESLEITITAKAGSEGKLYGSIGAADIAEAITAAGEVIGKREVRLPTGPLRKTGEYEVAIHLHTDVNATVKIVVLPEE
jgi:large subunit ribosomal protein L9